MSTTVRPENAMAASNSTGEVEASISEFLRSKNVPPTQQWLRDFMPSIRLNTPLVALQKTALFRLLASDLTVSVQAPPVSIFPTNISSPEIEERKLPGPITVQVLDTEDIGHSRWSQVETIEAHERGETTKGREVIRVVPEDTTSDPTPATRRSGPHKLLLQDAKGTKIYAFDFQAVSGVSMQMSIGAKLVLRNVVAARGLVLLEPKCVEVLGGKVEAWDKKWRSERKEVLKWKAGIGGVEGG